MILRLHSRALRSTAFLIVIILTLFAASLITGPWRARWGLGKLATSKELLRAVKYDHKNPSYYYRLGLHSSYGPAERDLSLARNRYIKAINFNPLNAGYWAELSSVYAAAPELGAGERALQRAIALNPTELKARWRMVNLRLRRGETDRALSELRPIIKDYPKQRTKAFSLLNSLAAAQGESIVRILEKGLPPEPEPAREYLAFLMGLGDTKGVKTMWKVLISRGFVPDSRTRINYINYLISHGEIGASRSQWYRYKDVAGEKEAGLVWNGGFEDDFTGGGFGWRVSKVKGARIGADSAVFHTGKRSMRIDFDGRHNVNFYHLTQIVPLEQSSTYVLKAYVKTEDITTTNGVSLQFYGINGCVFSRQTETLVGTSDWKELSIDVVTPAGCSAGAVRVTRVKSGKLDNLIGGRVWIDSVRLERTYAAAS